MLALDYTNNVDKTSAMINALSILKWFLFHGTIYIQKKTASTTLKCTEIQSIIS